jgi:NodT family efflux transporter outer membrane factor (OMF) lipoprotein
MGRPGKVSKGMDMSGKYTTNRVRVLAHRLVRLITMAGILGLAAGCMVGPDYVRPKTPVPEMYKEMEGWKIAQPRDHMIREAWWEVFGDPELNGLEEQIDISNQNVAAAEAQYRQSRALVKAARAGYFPTATIGASFTRSLRSSTLAQGTTTSSGPTSDYLLPADVAWEADIWGRIRRTVEASRAGAQASAADLEAVRLSARAELAQDYFLLRTLDDQKHLLEATVLAYGKVLDITKNRYANGVASKGDVLQAETQLKTTQALAIDVGIQRAQLEHAIALLVGKPAAAFSISAVPLAMALPVVPAGLPSELLERRPDIAGAERRVAAANAQIGVAKAAFFPTVTLSASGGYESSDLSKWLTWPSRFWAVGPALAETVFDGGLRRARTEQARAVYDAAVASYRQTVLTGFQEVEDNLAALRILEEEALAQDDAVKAARQSLEFTTNQYNEGTVSYLNVLVAQTIALNNERTAVDILGRRTVASVLLIKALGGGWNPSSLHLKPDSGQAEP